MNILQGILLGIVQGLTEFLPVSSSGHLVLLQRIFGITQGNLFFTTLLHLGTLLAVLIVFYKDIWYLLTHPLSKQTLCLLVSTVVTGVFYLVLKKPLDQAFGGDFLVVGFLYTAAVLFVSEKIAGKDKKNMNGIHAALIGGMQGIALFPGVSRSGSTIAGGLFCGLDKDYAARYSFLLSIPAILVGAVSEVMELESLAEVPWAATLIGMVFAFAAGLFAIQAMLRVIKRQKLTYFSIYLVILSALILLDQFVFHVFL